MTSLPSYDSSNIKTMSTLEDFRVNSSQYIGSGGIDTDCQMAKEIIDNAADESLDKSKIYNIKIVIFTNGKRYQFCVIDYGRGIPCDSLKNVYTLRATSGKYDTRAYNGLSVGTWGVGSKLVVALSDVFVSISKRSDGFAGIRFEKGVDKEYKIIKAIDKNQETNGTTVIYETDRSIVKESDSYISSENGLAETLKLIDFISATKQNTKFTVYRVNELLPKEWYEKPFAEQWRYLQEVEGVKIYASSNDVSLFTYAKKQFGITEKTIWNFTVEKQINRNDDSDRIGYDIHVGMTAHAEKQNGLIGIVNDNPVNNPKSSHLVVLQQKLKKQLVQYFDEDNHELVTFFESQYWIPLHGYVQVYCKNAKFISQTKTSFENVDFARLYGLSLDKKLATSNSNIWAELYDLVIDDVIDKFEAAISKQYNTGKSLKNVAFKLSRTGSYVPCEINNPNVTELLITEGKSAGDAAKQQRNAKYQAILKLRGKPWNAIKGDDIMDNVICTDLMRLLGVGPRDTTLDNFNYRSIGLLADADPDGYHIICLLIGCLLKINPLILKSGRVWVANPPLYVYTSKDYTLYMRDEKALNDTRIKIYSNYFKFHIKNLVNGHEVELTNETFRDFIYLVKRIGSAIRDSSTKLAIDPFILEQLTHVSKWLSLASLNCEAIKEALNLERCEYSRLANILLLVSDGSEISIPMSDLVKEIDQHIMPEVAPIHWGKIQPLITTLTTDMYNKTPLTFMQIDKILSEIDKVYNVSRMKGLGECEPETLRYSCIDPATRSYTIIRDIGDVNRLYQLLGVDPTWRKELAKRRVEEVMAEV